MKKRKYSFYAAFSFLLLSGILWVVAHYFLRSHGEFGDTVNPLEPLSLKLHGAAVLIASFSAGTMLPGHANLHWRHERNKIAGALMITILAALAITGWVLYYAVTEENQGTVSLIHWIIGLLMLPIVILHRFSGRKSIKK